jgi:hypothetical protein
MENHIKSIFNSQINYRLLDRVQELCNELPEGMVSLLWAMVLGRTAPL